MCEGLFFSLFYKSQIIMGCKRNKPPPASIGVGTGTSSHQPVVECFTLTALQVYSFKKYSSKNKRLIKSLSLNSEGIRGQSAVRHRCVFRLRSDWRRCCFFPLVLLRDVRSPTAHFPPSNLFSGPSRMCSRDVELIISR